MTNGVDLSRRYEGGPAYDGPDNLEEIDWSDGASAVQDGKDDVTLRLLKETVERQAKEIAELNLRLDQEWHKVAAGQQVNKAIKELLPVWPDPAVLVQMIWRLGESDVAPKTLEVAMQAAVVLAKIRSLLE